MNLAADLSEAAVPPQPLLPHRRIAAAAMLCAVLCAAAAPARAAATLDVSFVEPQTYADAGTVPWEIEQTTRRLSTHLQRLSERYLAPDQSLRLEVLDIDLAGHVRHPPSRDLRTVNGGTDSPSIRLRYTLYTPGSDARSGEERIVALDYLPPGRVPRLHDPLPYERHMLEEWFKARFAAQPR